MVGVTSGFAAFGESLAAAGFIAGLADLFNGHTAVDVEAAKALRGAPRRVPMYKTPIGNIEDLCNEVGTERGNIGVVGFSMGGHWAVWLSQRAELPVATTVSLLSGPCRQLRG